MRKNREFYVWIKETDVGGWSPFADRQVEIRLSNPHEARPILERNVDVGVVVLLGTGLHVAEDTKMEAHLLPVSKG